MMDNNGQKKVQQVSVDEVKRAIDGNEHILLLDVRTTAEYAKGRIAGSINLPVDNLEQEILTTVPDKSTTVYVYCLSGSRSVYAVGVMAKLGYTNVFDVAQGLLAWRVKGYPVNF